MIQDVHTYTHSITIHSSTIYLPFARGALQHLGTIPLPRLFPIPSRGILPRHTLLLVLELPLLELLALALAHLHLIVSAGFLPCQICLGALEAALGCLQDLPRPLTFFLERQLLAAALSLHGLQHLAELLAFGL